MTPVLRHISGVVAAALVAATTLVGLSTGPAAAALCSGGGINVVVDRGALGGGIAKACDSDGSGSARNNFTDAGFTLKDAARQPGFICRVNGAPTSDPCVNASPSNAYWGLFWSDGKSGTWSYASSGVDGLDVPDGGWVAFSWQNGGAEDKPGVTPRAATPTTAAPRPSRTPQPSAAPRPTSRPTATASAQPSKQPSKQPSNRPSNRASARAEASAKASARASASATASATPGEEESEAVVAGDDPTLTPLEGASSSRRTEDGGLPVWVPGVGVVGLLSAAGGIAWWRRRSLVG